MAISKVAEGVAQQLEELAQKIPEDQQEKTATDQVELDLTHTLNFLKFFTASGGGN
jgi:hypothetical protein